MEHRQRRMSTPSSNDPQAPTRVTAASQRLGLRTLSTNQQNISRLSTKAEGPLKAKVVKVPRPRIEEPPIKKATATCVHVATQTTVSVSCNEEDWKSEVDLADLSNSSHFAYWRSLAEEREKELESKTDQLLKCTYSITQVRSELAQVEKYVRQAQLAMNERSYWQLKNKQNQEEMNSEKLSEGNE